MQIGDVEWAPRGAAGTLEGWKQLYPALPLEDPTYSPDLVGPLARFDERDCLFARRDLNPGSQGYQEFYRRHPEHQQFDDAMRSLPYLGHTELPQNRAMLQSLFASMLLLASEETVEGRFVPSAADASCVDMAPETAAAKVKGFARLVGADLVGIGPLRREFVYTNVGRAHSGQTYGEPIELSHPYAISLGIRMNSAGLSRTAPHFPEILESSLAYARGAFMAVQLAAYIRSMGYAAQAHHFRNYQILSVPVAVDGGLGELARCGFLVTQEYGNCLRLATVTTELPLLLDKPVDIGVQEFCERCVICAKACPAGAIPEGGKREVRGARKWTLDAEKCYRYWHEAGTDCGICIATCPWSRWTVGPRPTEGEPVVPGGFYVPARRPDWLL
jgi:ferredoxin